MRYVLSNASIVDGTADKPFAGHVYVDGSTISQIDRHKGELPEGLPVVDLDGATIIPGLIDAHSHVGHAFDRPTLRDVGDVSAAEVAAEIFINLEIACDEGFTTIRELGGVDGGVAEAVDRGLVRGPRVLPSGPALVQTGGHGTQLGRFSQHCGTFDILGLVSRTTTCDGEAEVRRAARTSLARGATQLKVYASGGVVGSQDAVTDAQFSVSELRVMVEEAAAQDTYVTAHAHSISAMRNAIAAGVRCLEHATYLDEETAEAIASAGIAIVPTLTVVHLIPERWETWGLNRSVLERLQGVGEAMRDSILLADAYNIPLGSGSDILGVEQRGRGTELWLKSTVIGPMAAIRSATSVNAQILGLQGSRGRIAEGMAADIVVLRSNPLDDMKLFMEPHNVSIVLKDGRPIKDVDSRMVFLDRERRERAM